MSQWIAGISRGHNASVCLLKDGEIASKEGDFGNAAELRMVLQEIHPESVIEIREFVGHLMSSS